MECIQKVLILEDDKLKYGLRDLLIREGFNINIGRSVNQVLKLVEEDHFDAAIIDIRLSKQGTEGLEAISKLRAIKQNIYLEVLTAYKEYKHRALDLGADNVSFKPGGIKGLAPRIKRGILEKELSTFANELGINKIPVDFIDTDNDGYQSAQVLFNTEFLTKSIININSFLDSFKLNIEQEKIERIKKGIMNIMIKQLTQKNISESPNFYEKVDPKLSNNENYLGFLKKIPELEKSYQDMYVAFVKGSFFEANVDLFELHSHLDQKYPQEDAFIKKISKEEKIILLKRPRRIIKN
jgi:ActR/RegA family two-component response regulator